MEASQAQESAAALETAKPLGVATVQEQELMGNQERSQPDC